MFTIKRNQVVVTALAVMIAAAGYLNFKESHSSEGTQTAMQLTEEGDSAAILDENYAALPDDMPDSDLDPVTAEASATKGDGAAVFASAGAGGEDISKYFAEAKLDREQSRAKQQDILSEMLNNQNITAAQKEKCSDNMLEMQERIEKETAAEAMIKAKGFPEAYVRIDDDTVDVVVGKDQLSETEVAQIQDIVNRKTGYEAEKIRISTWKKGK